MSLRPLASMLVKVLALYTIVQSLNALEMVWRPLLSLMDGGVSLGPTSPFGLYVTWADAIPGLLVGLAQITVGVVLWQRSELIARAIVSEDEAIVPVTGGSEMRVDLGLLGTYLIADGISRFAMILVIGRENTQTTTPSMMTVFLVPAAVRAAIGVWLLLGARGIVRGVANLKNWGRDVETEENR